MATSGHLWAVRYEDIGRANEVRDTIVSLGWDQHSFILEDVAVVVRHPDGSFSLNREPFPAASNILGYTAVGFLAGLVLGMPLPGAAIGAVVGGAGTALSARAGIADRHSHSEIELANETVREAVTADVIDHVINAAG